MAQGRVTFLPPPQVPGVSEGEPSQEMLMKQLAMAGGDMPGMGREQASQMIAQGMMLLQQAAMLDPRIAPLVRRALEPLMGGLGSPSLSAPQKDRSSGVPTPGGYIPTTA